MEKRKAANILDNIFTYAGIWLLAFLWTRYYERNLLIAILVATSITLCLIFFFNLRKKKKKNSRVKQKRIDETINQFIYNDEAFALGFFADAIGKKYTVIRKSNYIKVNSTILFFDFSQKQAGFDQIIKYYVTANKTKSKKLLVLTSESTDKKTLDSIANLPDIDIEIFDKNKCYEFLRWLGSFPEIKIVIKPAKASFKKIMAAAISPARSKHYLFVSIVLMLGSYFIPYSIYYIVMASVCLALAILSRFDIVEKLKKNKKAKNEK